MSRTTKSVTTSSPSDLDAVAKAVEQSYTTRFRHPFLYKDCYKLQRLQASLARDLIPDLDLYFSFVAGYSSSATTLNERPITELRAAIPKLQKSFFEMMPKYRTLRKYITPKTTPDLHKDLRVINDLRQSLVILTNQLV